MQFRIITAHTPPRVFQYADAARALRKLVTLRRTGIRFSLTDDRGAPIEPEALELALARTGAVLPRV